MRTVRKSVRHYNLDLVFSVGYRVNIKRATQFRIRATLRLRECQMSGDIVHKTACVSWGR